MLLSREIRAFHVETFDAGKTGPLDFARRVVCTRAEFRRQLQHVTLAGGQHKSSVGAWVPVDSKTRAEGGTTATRKGFDFPEPTQVGRHLENVTGSSASTMLDIDKLPVERWVALLERVRELGWSGESWSTASYAPESGLVSARMHLHLDRELTSAEEVERVRRAVDQLLGGGVADRACFGAVAVFYLPATRGHHFVETFDGAEIVVDALPPVAVAPKRSRVPRPMVAGQLAEERDRDLAREELSRHCARIAFHPNEHIRDLTAKGKTYYLGQYVAGGALTVEEVRESFELALTSWAERQWPGEDNSEEIERRLDQVFAEAIADGVNRGAALPADRLTPKEELEAKVAEPAPEWISADAAAEAARGYRGIVALPPGVGKTRTALRQIAESRRDAIVYAPSHALAEEHREALVRLGVPAAEIAHEMSPLHRPAGGEEGCERSRASRAAAGTPDDQPSPFAVTIRQAHINLRASVCPSCPMRDGCPVRYVAKSRARVRLRVHAAYEPVEPGKALVFLDEEPETHERLEVTRSHLRELTGKHSSVLGILTGAHYAYWTPAEVERERGRRLEEAALAGEDPTPLDLGQAYYVRQAALALKAGRRVPDAILGGLATSGGSVRLSAAVAKRLADDPASGLPVPPDALEAVRAVLALATSGRGAVGRLDGTLEVIAETPALRDTRRGYVTLLSATPTPGAYPGLEPYAPHVADGCAGISREVLFLAHSGSTNFKMNASGVLDVCERLLAGRTFDGRVLCISFKSVVAAYAPRLRAMFPEADDVQLRWFGAVAGSNLYQQDAEFEAQHVVTIGDYYANRRWLFEHLAVESGLEELEEVEAYVRDAGEVQVAQELAQAHGRARDPRRTRPVAHLHLGRTIPLGWEGRSSHRDLDGVRADQRAASQRTALAGLERRIAASSVTTVARTLGVARTDVQKWKTGKRPIPEKCVQKLAELAVRQ